MKLVFELGGLFRTHGWKLHINRHNKNTGSWYWDMERTALSLNSKPSGDPVNINVWPGEPWHKQNFHTTGQYEQLYIKMIQYKTI